MPSSQRDTKSTGIYETISSGKKKKERKENETLKPSWLTPTHQAMRKKTHINVNSGGWDIILPQTSLPMRQHTIKKEFNVELLPEEWSVWNPLGHPNFSELHLRDELPKHLALTRAGACARETHKAIRNCEMAPKGLTCLDSSAPGPRAEAGDWEVPRFYVKDVFLS